MLWNKRKVFTHNSGALEVWNKNVNKAMLPLNTLKEKPLLTLPSSWCLLEISDVSWLVATSLQSLPLITWPSFLLLLLRTPSLDLGPTLIQYDFILNWLCLQRPYFQIKLHSQVPEILKFHHNFPWGPNSTNNFRIT